MIYFSPGLNDGDLIGFGSNPTPDSCKGEKRTFLYRIRAPTTMTAGGNDDEEVDENAGEAL